MRMINKFSCALLVALTCQAQAASVWKVSSGQHSLYIGGTIHILSPDDYPLPAEYESAFKQADVLVFETDMATVNSLEFQQKMLSQMIYADGTTVDKVLKPETYTALKNYLISRNVPPEAMATMKPSLIALTISMIELQALGFTSEGVDQFYANKALEVNKAQHWLESPDEQISFLVDLGKEDESGMIDYALKDIKKLPETIEDIRSSWRSGDMQKMAELSITEFKTDYPQIYQDLLVSRNNNWLPQIQSMLNDEPVEFILVGAMHLAGPDGVLSKLAAQGYKIEKL